MSAGTDWYNTTVDPDLPPCGTFMDPPADIGIALNEGFGGPGFFDTWIDTPSTDPDRYVYVCEQTDSDFGPTFFEIDRRYVSGGESGGVAGNLATGGFFANFGTEPGATTQTRWRAMNITADGNPTDPAACWSVWVYSDVLTYPS